MVNEYTISELAEIFGISKQATDKKVKKLEVGGLKTTIKSINNRPTKIVYLSDDELNELINNRINNQSIYQQDTTDNQLQYQQEQPTSYDVMQLLATYAEKSGKYDLLEDKQKELREDVKYWQNKYFEKENEIKNLIKLNANLEKENNELKAKNSQLEVKRGFLGLFKG